MSEVTITVTVSTHLTEALLACIELIQDEPPIMLGGRLRSLAERLWGATIIPGAAGPKGAAPDPRPGIMPTSFDDTCEADEWRLAAHFLHQAAFSIDAHLDKLEVTP